MDPTAKTRAEQVASFIGMLLVGALGCSKGSDAPGAAVASQPDVNSVLERSPYDATARESSVPSVGAAMNGETTANGERSADELRARLVFEGCDERRARFAAQIDREVERMRRKVEKMHEEWLGLPTCSETTDHRAPWTRDLVPGRADLVAHMTDDPRARENLRVNNAIDGREREYLVAQDAQHLYLGLNRVLRIIDAATMSVVSTTPLPGPATRLLLDGDRVVAIVSVGGHTMTAACGFGLECHLPAQDSHTKLLVFDTANKRAPEKLRELELSGTFVGEHLTGHALHVVVATKGAEVPGWHWWPSYVSHCREDDDAVSAAFLDLEQTNEHVIRATLQPTAHITTDRDERALCDVWRTPEEDGNALTTIVSLTTNNPDDSPKILTIESHPTEITFSGQSLFVATVRKVRAAGEPVSIADTTTSEIHRFHVDEEPSGTRYLGSGVVPGRVVRASVDEKDGHVRVVTAESVPLTKDDRVTLSILSSTQKGDLTTVGQIDHAAPGHTIRGVHFDGSRVDVATLGGATPFFVFDTGSPFQPAFLGKLDVPALSTFLYRLDATHLLWAGISFSHDGDFFYSQDLVLRILDDTRPTKPAVLYETRITSKRLASFGNALDLSLNYDPTAHLLALPMTSYARRGASDVQREPTFSGLLVYRLSLEHGFTKLGAIDRSTTGPGARAVRWPKTEIAAHGVFIGNSVFSLASDQLRARRIDALDKDVIDVPLAP
jgi:hypothetical protein